MKKNKYKSPVLIAEIGCNHMGKIDLAKKFIDISKKFCDLKYVKFQKDIPKPYYQKRILFTPSCS